MDQAYLLIGGNEGDRVAFLDRATVLIEAECGRIRRRSSVYETAAWGYRQQGDFLNQVLLLETGLEPSALLVRLLDIEKRMGRMRGERNGPRTIDIDILLYGDRVVDLPDLALPHPRMASRRFTLVPLTEIAPSLRHPVSGKTMQRLLLECPDDLPVRKYSTAVKK